MSLTAESTIMSGKSRVLSGITVIDTPLITRAMDYARIHSEPFLFNMLSDPHRGGGIGRSPRSRPELVPRVAAGLASRIAVPSGGDVYDG
jgi:hypothetical protein